MNQYGYVRFEIRDVLWRYLWYILDMNPIERGWWKNWWLYKGK